MCALICAVRFSRRITQGGGCWLLCADNGTDYGGGAAQGVPDTQRKNSGNQAGTASRVKTASLEEEGETRPATAKKSCGAKNLAVLREDRGIGFYPAPRLFVDVELDGLGYPGLLPSVDGLPVVPKLPRGL